MKRMTGTLLIVFTLILTMFSGTVSYASAISSIVFEGLDVGDVVEIYRICNYDEKPQRQRRQRQGELKKAAKTR